VAESVHRLTAQVMGPTEVRAHRDGMPVPPTLRKVLPLTSLVVLIGTAACVTPFAEEADTAPHAEDDGSDEGQPAEPSCVDDDVVAVFEFTGPGWDPESGLVEPLQDNYLAHTTFAQLRPGPQIEQTFIETNLALVPVLMAQEGLIGFQLGFSQKCKSGRTLGVWRSEEAMVEFVITPEHVQAMAMAPELMSSAGFHSWTIERAEVPFDFDHAKAMLASVDPKTY
jgi:quinol monooxygenase YgiN